MPAVTRAFAGLGAALIALGVFLPYATFDGESGGVSILDPDQLDTTIGFALEPLAVAAAALVALVSTRVEPRLIAVLLATMGAQTSLMYVGYAVFASSTEGATFGAGAIVGLVGSILLLTAGLLFLRAKHSSRGPTADEAGVPSGWYADPVGEATERFWDGRTWTEQTR